MAIVTCPYCLGKTDIGRWTGGRVVCGECGRVLVEEEKSADNGTR
jgi:hypothetical protein